jgi:hypothetical protein
MAAGESGGQRKQPGVASGESVGWRMAGSAMAVGVASYSNVGISEM